MSSTRLGEAAPVDSGEFALVPGWSTGASSPVNASPCSSPMSLASRSAVASPLASPLISPGESDGSRNAAPKSLRKRVPARRSSEGVPVLAGEAGGSSSSTAPGTRRASAEPVSSPEGIHDMASLTLPYVGARVRFTNRGGLDPGTVAFVGATEFAPGVWIGINCDEPIGKNDGIVKETRYFECAEQHGIFVRPRAIMSVEQFKFEPFSRKSSASESTQSPSPFSPLSDVTPDHRLRCNSSGLKLAQAEFKPFLRTDELQEELSTCSEIVVPHDALEAEMREIGQELQFEEQLRERDAETFQATISELRQEARQAEVSVEYCRAEVQTSRDEMEALCQHEAMVERRARETEERNGLTARRGLHLVQAELSAAKAELQMSQECCSALRSEARLSQEEASMQMRHLSVPVPASSRPSNASLASTDSAGAKRLSNAVGYLKRVSGTVLTLSVSTDKNSDDEDDAKSTVSEVWQDSEQQESKRRVTTQAEAEAEVGESKSMHDAWKEAAQSVSSTLRAKSMARRMMRSSGRAKAQGEIPRVDEETQNDAHPSLCHRSWRNPSLPLPPIIRDTSLPLPPVMEEPHA